MSACTIYQYREPLKDDSYYASRLPASSVHPKVIETTNKELTTFLSKEQKTVHTLKINAEYFKSNTFEVMKQVKDYLYSLDPDQDIVHIESNLMILNKVSALCYGYGLESFYVTANQKVKPQFLFYVSKVYVLPENSPRMPASLGSKSFSVSQSN